MKRKFFAKLTLMLVLAGFLAGCGSDVGSIVLQDVHGKQYVLKNYHGKWIVINYYASWCKPCFKEIPALNLLSKDYSNKVLVLGVNYDRATGTELRNIIQKMHVEFPTLTTDPAKALGIGHIPGLPATYLINPKGQLVKRLLGVQTEQSLVNAMSLA